MGKLNLEKGNENDSNRPTMRNGETEKDNYSNTITMNENRTKRRRLRFKKNEGNSYSREKETKVKKLEIARSKDENIL
jgi:hypothetical protein